MSVCDDPEAHRRFAATDDRLLEDIRMIVNRVKGLPVLDTRPAEEILGYIQSGGFE